MLTTACLAALSGQLHAPRSGFGQETSEKISLETSDGIPIAAWFYPVPEGTKSLATVILVHDLEGSHKTVEQLAVSLQNGGCAVVAPDLRRHGASGARPAGAASANKGDSADPRQLKKQDLEAIAASQGGRLRDQSLLRGEIEAARNWIAKNSGSGGVNLDKLCVVGSGIGATLATMWTAADWSWLPTASGPQGQQVRALVLVSPVWASKGISLSFPLQNPALQQRVPIMLLGGKADRDAGRLFDQLKRLRPESWFQQRSGQADKARELDDPAAATVFFLQNDSSLVGDKLASEPSLGAADQIKTFISIALDRKPE
jgi:pimeloyl-ACP methyl ester carboxylesterase